MTAATAKLLAEFTACQLAETILVLKSTTAPEANTLYLRQVEVDLHDATERILQLEAEYLAEATSREAAVAALRLCYAVLPDLEVRSWPPGHKMKDDAIAACERILSVADGWKEMSIPSPRPCGEPNPADYGYGVREMTVLEHATEDSKNGGYHAGYCAGIAPDLTYTDPDYRWGVNQRAFDNLRPPVKFIDPAEVPPNSEPEESPF